MQRQLINNRIFYLLIIVLFVPIVVMFIASFMNSESGSLSINGYNELIEKVRLKELSNIVLRSFYIGFTATIVSYIISYLLVQFTSSKFQLFFLVLITLPFLSNEAVRVFSWQNILAENGILNKIITRLHLSNTPVFNSANSNNIFVTMLITCIPFAIFISTATLKIIPEIYWKVSDDLKIGAINKLIKVALPMSKFALLCSFIVTFFIAFALSSEVSFLGGASKISMRGFVLSLMSANRYEAIFGLGVILFLILLLFYTATLYMLKLKEYEGN